MGMNSISMDMGDAGHHPTPTPQQDLALSSLHPTTTLLPHQLHSIIDNNDDEDGDTLEDHPQPGSDDNTPAGAASTSPVISHLGPISPVEELTPAAISTTSTSSSRRRRPPLLPNSSSATLSPSDSTSTPPPSTTDTTASSSSSTNSSTGTCRLVLDWSRTRTSGAIFRSSSGVSRVQVAVRPPASRARASIERLKWSASSAILYNSSARSKPHSGANSQATTVVIPPSPTRAPDNIQ